MIFWKEFIIENKEIYLNPLNNWNKSMSKIQNKTDDDLGLGQNTTVSFGSVYKVTDLSNGQLVTTSGRLNTSTLDDTVIAVKAAYTNRAADYVFSLSGQTVGILHQNDSWEPEP